jgi:hypothetical protein
MNASLLSFWDDLLELIDERRVIPILGPELLRTSFNGTEMPLHQALACRLSDKLGIRQEEPCEDSLNRVICRYIEEGGRREDIYPRIRSLFKEMTIATPEPLKKLAGIRHFNLFVTTTFDSLLQRALDEVRFGGMPRTKAIAYAPNNVQDLPEEKPEEPVVFHLLGRLSAAPEYVITQEDTLEFLYAMQSEKRRPELLFDELKSNNLLLIGTSFPDWLARFFIRLAKGNRLSGPRDSLEIVADSSARNDHNLVLFLKSFSYRTQVYGEGGALEFVDELSHRYLARHPETSPRKERAAEGGGAEAAGAEDMGEMPEGAIFISYASQDRAAAKSIRTALEGANVDVWFDQARLEGGDDYDRKIRRNIKNCSLFMPLISANTRAREEGYFRLEWRLAVERSMMIDDSIPFILPISIDDTHANEEARVPGRFLSLQWTKVPGGVATPEFVEHVVKVIRARRKRERGKA